MLIYFASGAVFQSLLLAPTALRSAWSRRRARCIVLGGVAAWLVLGEPNPVRRLVWSVVVVAGIAAIAAP